MQIHMVLRTDYALDEAACLWAVLARNKTAFARRVLAAYGEVLVTAYGALRETFSANELIKLVEFACGPALQAHDQLASLSPEARDRLQVVVQALGDLDRVDTADVLLDALEAGAHTRGEQT